ncbi:MAG TPA: hypothetical protein VK508_06705 [Cyclobacteriaceae bacterium]|nr:hypothetical protein [Cyclobacteriaceae bacterium]
MNTDMSIRKFSPLWNKYRPAILKMMLAAADQPQQYKLMQHEVVAMDSKKKSGWGFTLQVKGSKAINKIKDSEMAQDLLNMLQLSPKASELMNTHTYEIVFDKQFTLHVTQVKAPVAPVESEVSQETKPE